MTTPGPDLSTPEGSSAAMSATQTSAGPGAAPDPDGPAHPGALGRLAQHVHFRNISAIYLWIILFAIFAIWTPGDFLAAGTWRTMADQEAVTTIVSLGLVISLSAGLFDLSAGLTLGASNATVAWAVVNAHMGIVPAVALGLASGVCIGLVNSFLVIELGISSFIATLATSSVLTAYVTWITANQQIEISIPIFNTLATYSIGGISWTFWVMIVVGIVIWYVLRYRPVGRHLYAAGGSPDAARLAGVRTARVTFGALMASSVIAALAGAILAMRVEIGSPTIGPPYLIPAFTAAFLGSTQFGRGRFNVWGTVIAVYALATGTTGLNLVGGPFWLPDLFDGVALALAVGLSASSAGSQLRTRLSRLGRRDREPAEPSVS
jgi:ribose transport system permease protein